MNDHRSCIPENIVAYIYSEMEPANVPAFERHLAECSACADEFATVSDARLSVFEWKRDAFDTLAVPHFEVPRETAKSVAARAGWLEAIFANIRLLAGAAAACVVLAIAAGSAFYFLKPTKPDLNAAVAPVTVPEKKIEVAEKQEPKPVESKPGPNAPEKKERVVTKREFAPVVVVARTRKPRVNNSFVAKATPTPQKTKLINQDRLPTLNNFEETEDDSLRLADLLADVDANNDK